MDLAATNETGRTAPKPSRNWALFLDIDGTLIDIAPTPDSVVVPDTLVPSLQAAGAWLGGALAIVSGRPLSAIDRLLGPTRFPCAAEHGAIVRLGDGTLLNADPGRAVPEDWKNTIADTVREWPGVIVEYKPYSVAAHFRLAPERAADVRRLFESVVTLGSGFEVLPAHSGCELRHHALHKGAAVRMFMERAPYCGRVPVFVGDDVTDEDGFRAARDLGGLGLHVSDAFAGQPSRVRRWLEAFRTPV